LQTRPRLAYTGRGDDVGNQLQFGGGPAITANSGAKLLTGTVFDELASRRNGCSAWPQFGTDDGHPATMSVGPKARLRAHQMTPATVKARRSRGSRRGRAAVFYGRGQAGRGSWLEAISRYVLSGELLRALRRLDQGAAWVIPFGIRQPSGS